MITVIAEAGVNHDGEIAKALELVDIAQQAGADIVKFQMFDPATCRADARANLESLGLTLAEFAQIKAHCDRRGIRFLASVFDCRYVDACIDLGLDTVKVASGEIVNLKLIEHIARSRLSMILSTGMSTLVEVGRAVDRFAFCGGKWLTLLHCVSLYPTPLELCNLAAVRTLLETFYCPVGFSDHTDSASHDAAIAAVGIGATVLEKHFTHDRRAPGPDHFMSLAPVELADYVSTVRLTHRMLGTGEKVPQPGEELMREKTRGRWR